MPDSCILFSQSLAFLHPMHLIIDKWLIVQLTSLLGEIGLNIQEAHAFSTVDGFSLDVFVVDGWPYDVWSENLLLIAFSCMFDI